MTARTRRASQSIVEAEPEHLDDSTSAERGQTRPPIVRPGLGIEERLAPGLELRALNRDSVDGELWMRNSLEAGDWWTSRHVANQA
jgi:hypothetical protein